MIESCDNQNSIKSFVDLKKIYQKHKRGEYEQETQENKNICVVWTDETKSPGA